MKVVFWVDSRVERGGGHLSRSLTLANALIANGHEVNFVLQDHSSFLDLTYITKYNASTHIDCLSQIRSINDDSDIDWIVIDNYDISNVEEDQLRPHTKNILVIDDLANRVHNCDLLVDQNIDTAVQNRYAALVPVGCKVLTGLRYLLARPQFYEDHHMDRSGTLIFLGGGNSSEVLFALSRVLTLIQPTELYKVLITSAYSISDFFGKPEYRNFEVYRDLRDPSSLFRSARRAIVRCGFVSYELALVGVPALNIFSTEIQREVSQRLEMMGYGTSISEEGLLVEQTLNNCLTVTESLNPRPLSRYFSPGILEITKEMELFHE